MGPEHPWRELPLNRMATHMLDEDNIYGAVMFVKAYIPEEIANPRDATLALLEPITMADLGKLSDILRIMLRPNIQAMAKRIKLDSERALRDEFTNYVCN
jgi:hypothetical protein